MAGQGGLGPQAQARRRHCAARRARRRLPGCEARGVPLQAGTVPTGPCVCGPFTPNQAHGQRLASKTAREGLLGILRVSPRCGTAKFAFINKLWVALVTASAVHEIVSELSRGVVFDAGVLIEGQVCERVEATDPVHPSGAPRVTAPSQSRDARQFKRFSFQRGAICWAKVSATTASG